MQGIHDAVKEGDEILVDLEAGKITNLTTKQTLEGTKLPPSIMEILADGGLIENLRKRMKK